jgi:hypothetical protein
MRVMHARSPRVIAVVAAELALWLGPGAGHATGTPPCPRPVASEVLAGSEVVVVGTIVETDRPLLAGDGPSPVVWTVDVDSVLKGEAPRELHVVGDDAPRLGRGDQPAVLSLERHGDDLVARWCVGLLSDPSMVRSIVAEAEGGHAPSTRADLPGATVPDVGVTDVELVLWGGGLVLGATAIMGLVRAQGRRDSVRRMDTP